MSAVVTFDGKVLAGVVAFGIGESLPPAFWAGLSKPLRDCLVVYKKLPAGATLQQVREALPGYAGRLGDERVAAALAVVDSAELSPPASGDLLREEYLAAQVNTVLSQYLAGEDVPLELTIGKVLEAMPVNSQNGVDDETDIGKLLTAAVVDTSPDVWGIPSIGHFMRPPKRGQFITLAARYGQGKTTFLMNLVMGMIQHPGATLKKVLWLNNEGDSGEIRLRAYEVALGCTLRDLHQMGPAEAQKRYEEVMGDAEVIVQGIHFQAWPQVRRVIEAHKPDVVVIDMIDHLGQGTGEAHHLVLEDLYLKVRGHATVAGYLALATSQLALPPPGSPVSTRRPGSDFLKGSRTGKQASAQDIWVLGHDDKHPEYRWLSFPKTKIALPGTPPKPSICLLFDRDTGRMIESPEPVEEPVLAPGATPLLASSFEDWE